MTVLGIDISRWQNNITTPQVMDFAKAKQAGANFAFIKASQATWKDRDFVMNWQNAKDAGLPRGAYHFMDWTTSAANQARYFASVLVDDPGELPPVADFECRTGAPTKARATEELYAFVSGVEQALGKRVMIYTAPYFWREFFSGAHANYFADRPLWIAHYGVTRPTVPAPWDAWTFWQYSAKGDGRLFGAESLDIDLDYYNGTPEQFAQFVGGVVIPVTWKLRAVAPLGLRIRTGPGTSFERVGALTFGSVVVVDKQQDNWARLADGRGWICTDWTVRV